MIFNIIKEVEIVSKTSLEFMHAMSSNDNFHLKRRQSQLQQRTTAWILLVRRKLGLARFHLQRLKLHHGRAEGKSVLGKLLDVDYGLSDRILYAQAFLSDPR